MPYIAIKYDKKGQNKLVSNKIQVKAFKDSDSLGAFMCSSQNDYNAWYAINTDKNPHNYPVKSGIYCFCGGQWHNIKTLPLNMR